MNGIFYSMNGINNTLTYKRLKQPLKILLGILVGSNIAAHVCISLTVFLSTFVKDFVFYIVVYTMMASITSSHLLNVFYCCQIISVQHPFFIWLKRNIKTVIYFALIVNTVLCLFGLSATLTAMSILNNYENTTVTKIDWLGLSDTTQGVLWMGLSFFSFSLSVMLISSCLSVVYLWRHLRNMQESSSSFTSPHRQRPIKSTIRGIILQALLHVICSFAVIINENLIKVLHWNFDCNSNITCMIVSFLFHYFILYFITLFLLMCFAYLCFLFIYSVKHFELHVCMKGAIQIKIIIIIIIIIR
uniref:Taste receptor type 2 n=1 Tax=Pygocentrus nattereri TaxID=42514 RepID=A0A3B4C720_PYGNA